MTLNPILIHFNHTAIFRQGSPPLHLTFDLILGKRNHSLMLFNTLQCDIIVEDRAEACAVDFAPIVFLERRFEFSVAHSVMNGYIYIINEPKTNQPK